MRKRGRRGGAGMIIAFSGAHSTGKTTMANEVYGSLPERLKGRVELATGLGRKCPYPLNKNATAKTQLWLYEEHLKILERNPEDKVILCDRTVADVISYTQWLIDNRSIGMASYVPEHWRINERYRHLFSRENWKHPSFKKGHKYHAVYVTSPMPGSAVEEDGARDPDVVYRDGIQAVIDGNWGQEGFSRSSAMILARRPPETQWEYVSMCRLEIERFFKGPGKAARPQEGA
jgi:hypothetical protein